MLDIKLLRNDFERANAAMARRGNEALDLKPFLELDERRRALIVRADELKARRNAASRDFGSAGVNRDELRQLSADIKDLDVELNALETEFDGLLLEFPNFPHESVPSGVDADDNVLIRSHLEPKKFEFEPKPHWDLGKDLGILDNEAAGATTGSRFMFLKGAGARLERALMNFMLDINTQNGYTEIFPPFIAHERSMMGTGQLPKFKDDAFKLEDWDYYLIPTAEVTVTNMHRDSILAANDLPLNYTAYSACFRAEAGSAGRDTRGLIRQHQFNKVELVKFTKPEDSYEQLELLTSHAEEILKRLELPYRVMLLCAGDMGFAAAKTYDLEVWMPSYDRYVEISSCSNFEDFQARRAKIRYKEAETGAKTVYVHTLNGSGLAIGRTSAAIMENYQNPDGSIEIPKALRPYMNGVEKMKRS
jgi:seryl-tRNA synthetase